MVCELGEIANAGLTVTVLLATAPSESVTRTTAEPEVAGAVYTPVDEFIVTVPLKTEYVKGPVPPTAVKVAVLFTATVFEAGDKLSVVVIVILASAIFPSESVTRATAVPFAAGAVYNPDEALILPVPLNLENVNGATPPD